MAKATTTTYLEIESIGADKLITTMAGLQKSLNFVAGMLKDLNRGLGLSSINARKGAVAIDAQAKAAANATANVNELRIAMAAQATATETLSKTVKNLTDAQKAQQKSLDWTALKSKIDLAKQAYDAIKNAVTGLFAESMKLSSAWEQQEKVELRLDAALKASGIKASAENFKNWAAEVQKSTRFGDEMALKIAGLTANFSASEKQTKKAAMAVINYSAATGRDATEAAGQLGRAVQGNAKALQSLGVYLNENERDFLKNANAGEKFSFVVAKMEEKYGGFAEALAKTPAGAFEQLQNIIGDIEEQLGRIVSPALWAGLEVAKDIFSDILGETNAITGDATQLKDIQTTLTNGLATAATVVLDIKAGVELTISALRIAANALLAAFTAAFKEWGLLFSKIGDIELLPDSLQAGLRKMGETLSLPFDFATDAIKADIKDIDTTLKNTSTAKEKIWADLDKYRREYQAAPRLTIAPENQGRGAPAVGPQEEKVKGIKVELDGELKALMDFYSKSEAAQAEFTAKRAALEQSAIIDYETKLDYKKQLDEQEQAALRDIKLEYARQTNDQLAIIEDQYRQEQLQKEAEAAKQQEAVRSATMQKLADNLKSVTSLGVDMFTSWIEGTGEWRAQLYDALKSFSKNLMATSLASIIDQALVNQSKAQGSQAGIPVVGPALALAAGIAMFATTMGLKNKLKPAEVQYVNGGYISAGMVRGGAYGRDSVSALLSPGERVLSAREAADYDQRENGKTERPINISVNISGQFSTPAQITDTVRRVLIPEIRSAVRAGYTLG